MRTVILFGLICIADSIGKQTGWEMSDRGVMIGAIIFIAAIIFDIVEIVRG